MLDIRGYENENNPPLSYEEFCMWEELRFNGKPAGEFARYNNFYLRFLLWPQLPHHESPVIKGMQKEIPALFRRIAEIISNHFLQTEIYKEIPLEKRTKLNMKEPNIKETLTIIQGELYQAYLVARRYVQNDEELFK